MLVQDLLVTQADSRADATAVICGSSRMSYSELAGDSARLANALRFLGVAAGDRVAIQLGNRAETVVAIFAALMAGGAIMMLHPTTRGDRLRSILRDAAPAVLVSDPEHHVESLLDQHELTRLRGVVLTNAAPEISIPSVIWHDLAAFPSSRPQLSTMPSALANLAYTSGSTGHPKGVICTHSNMIAATCSINAYLKNRPDDVIYCALPLSFGYGLYQLFLAAQVGASVILESGLAFPAQSIQQMEIERVTAFPGVPTMFSKLLRFPDLLGGRLETLRYVTNAGAGIPPMDVRRLRELLPHVKFYCMYGQAECTRISYLPPEEVDRRPESVGLAIPGTEVEVVDEEGRRASPGIVGELIVRGPHVNRGYWNAPEATSAKFALDPDGNAGTLRTGDLFRTDADGFLYFVGRKDDIFKVGGEKVSPGEVESVITKHAGVAEVAVVGVPDTLRGHAVLLAVVPKPGVHLTKRELASFCARELDDYMRPKHIVIADHLPQTSNGKVDKRALVEKFSWAQPLAVGEYRS